MDVWIRHPHLTSTEKRLHTDWVSPACCGVACDPLVAINHLAANRAGLALATGSGDGGLVTGTLVVGVLDSVGLLLSAAGLVLLLLLGGVDGLGVLGGHDDR
eukprot:TRINITY_DN728_c0_g2_i11.p1 TRINITY_DN728_c0_g2~~TRINITY_DN728_c0_g2_i11.p1  ORF type:complete len:102 (+),score=4.96 TRINITY_DN728_c0_g2_i11:131-436(+)